MRALRFHGPSDIRVEDVREPERPAPGEVVLRVLACGICGSDALEYRQGPVLIRPLDRPHPVTGHTGPVTLGHEFAGEVAAVGAGVEHLVEGMLVSCGAGMSCGSCRPCRGGRTNLCVRYATLGFHRDGGLAEYCSTPAAICFDAREYGLGADTAALAQPMAIAVHAARRGRCREGETVVVLGVGGIGSFIAYAAASWGANVVVCDLDDGRLELACSLGAASVVRLGEGRRLSQALAELDLAPDVVLEASGSATALAEAVEAAPRGTRVVAVGVQKTPPKVDMSRVTLEELELIGTVAHEAATDVPEALRLLGRRGEGWADVAPLALPLMDTVTDGLMPLAEGRAERVKTLIDPWISDTRPTDTVLDSSATV